MTSNSDAATKHSDSMMIGGAAIADIERVTMRGSCVENPGGAQSGSCDRI
jgi:hypothetical protein